MRPYSEADAAVHRAKILEGIERFNRLEFWEAHDSWETVWLGAPPREARFIQGLIQIAAAYVLIRRRRPNGALRLLPSALAKLEEFEAGHGGIDRSEVVAAAARHFEMLSADPEHLFADAEFPRLSLLRSQD